jgi:hypothetical protein
MKAFHDPSQFLHTVAFFIDFPSYMQMTYLTFKIDSILCTAITKPLTND